MSPSPSILLKSLVPPTVTQDTVRDQWNHPTAHDLVGPEIETIIQAISELLQTSYDQFRVVAVSLGLWGVLTGLMACTAVILKRQGLQQRSRRILAVSILLLYILSALYWVNLLVGLSNNLREMLSIATFSQFRSLPFARCVVGWFDAHDEEVGNALCRDLIGSAELEYIQTAEDRAFNKRSRSNPATTMSSIAFALSVAVGDAIVWWRACVIWSRNRAVIALAVGAVTAVSVTGVAAPTIIATGPGLASWFSKYGVAASGLSLLSNGFTTTLIAYKAWEHRRTFKKTLEGQSVTTQAQRILTLLAESGAAYCVLWIIVLTIQADASKNASNPIGRALGVGTNFDLFFEGALPMLVAMYPTLVVLLVSIQAQQGTMHFTQQSTSGVLPVAIPLRRISVTSLDHDYDSIAPNSAATSSTDSLPAPSPTLSPRIDRRSSIPESLTLTHSIMGDARLRQFGIDYESPGSS